MSIQQTETSSCRFTTKQGSNSKTIIRLELFHNTVPYLDDVVVEFDLLSGATPSDARKLVETMNERILGIMLRPK
jgi:FMN-dependent NADH-azoreductase